MMHISQIVRKWRESGQEEQGKVASSSSFGKVVYNILAIYEKDLESMRNQLPDFIGALQEKKVVIKEAVPKVEATKKPFVETEALDKPKNIELQPKIKDAKDAKDEKDENWDNELSDFTQGLYEDEKEMAWIAPAPKKEKFRKIDNINEEKKKKEEEEDEDEDEDESAPPELREDFFVSEEPEPVNLEKLLQSMKEDETSAKEDKEPSKNKGPFRRAKRKRVNIDRKRKRKKNDWQDPKKK